MCLARRKSRAGTRVRDSGRPEDRGQGPETEAWTLGEKRKPAVREHSGGTIESMLVSEAEQVKGSVVS